MAQQCTSMEGMEGLKSSPNLTRQFCLFGMGGMRRAYAQASGPGCVFDASAKAAREKKKTSPSWQPSANLLKAKVTFRVFAWQFLGPRVGICSTLLRARRFFMT